MPNYKFKKAIGSKRKEGRVIIPEAQNNEPQNKWKLKIMNLNISNSLIYRSF
jgi:hypothetical protein